MLSTAKSYIQKNQFGFISIIMGGLFYISPIFTIPFSDVSLKWAVMIILTWIANILGFTFCFLGKKKDRDKALWIISLLFHIFIGLFSIGFAFLMIAGILG